MQLDQLCNKVCELTKEVAAFISNERKIFSSSSIVYKGHNDMVSYVDKTAEQKLVAGLSKFLPEAGFITEEKTVEQHVGKAGSNAYRWIIDPLDGTTNFIHGVPCFCISIALMKEDELVLGVVHEVNLDECFSAFKDGGAFLNGNKISVSQVNKLKDSLLATGFPYSNYTRMKEYMNVFGYLMHNTHGVRRLGSAAVDLAYVACGRFEGFYEYGLNAWDVAAGALLVKEAGGKVTDFSGGDHFVFGREIISCNANVFDEFLDIVKENFFQ